MQMTVVASVSLVILCDTAAAHLSALRASIAAEAAFSYIRMSYLLCSESDWEQTTGEYIAI